MEYEDQTTPSVYVKFPVKTVPAALARAVGGRPVSLVIWTTTPWTLPANLAIAVHPDETYTAVELDGQALIVAQPLLEAFLRLPGVKGLGAALAARGARRRRSRARSPGTRGSIATSPVLAADFVAMDAGTGLVHIAPGHGEEDYELGRRAGLKIYNPVDDDGRFIAEVAHFAGQTVWEANPQHHRAPARGRRARGRGAAPAHLPALLALQEPDALPRHRAVVHLARPDTGSARRRSTRSGTR